MPGFHAGRPPGNVRVRYRADPPTVEDIVAVMRAAGDTVHGRPLRGLIVVRWRAGRESAKRSRSVRPIWTRVAARCACAEAEAAAAAEVGMDDGAWEQLEVRRESPVGPLFCVVTGPTGGRR
jgi:hypothetical protein